MNPIYPVEMIPHCRAITGNKEDHSEHFDSDKKALSFALQNDYNIIVHFTKPSLRKYYFARRNLPTMTNLNSVTIDENKSAYEYTTWVIRI